MRPFTIWLLLSLLVVSCSKVDNTGRVPVPGETFRAKLASLNWGTDTTFVYGHKTPDVDAITSSLSYAKLMRTLGYNCKAKVSSPTNRESANISALFGFELFERNLGLLLFCQLGETFFELLGLRLKLIVGHLGIFGAKLINFIDATAETAKRALLRIAKNMLQEFSHARFVGKFVGRLLLFRGFFGLFGFFGFLFHPYLF